MVVQRRELRMRLEHDGWKVVEDEPGDEWWVDERWKVESTWRPLVFMSGYRSWWIRSTMGHATVANMYGRSASHRLALRIGTK